MQFFIISSVVLLLTSITLLFLLRKANKNAKIEIDKVKNDFNNLNNKIIKLKHFMSPDTGRTGYYIDIVTLMSPEDKKSGTNIGDNYTLTLYVKEIDRYTNGKSKIELTNLELTSGFDPGKFEYVKRTRREKFSSLKTTSEIEWLESEENIKELRKQKLEKLESVLIVENKYKIKEIRYISETPKSF